jgi:hypothetical protein
MKTKILLSLVLALILSGCAVPAKFLTSNYIENVEQNNIVEPISFEKIIRKTEPRFIDELIDKIELPNELLSVLQAKDKIIVKSIERDYYSDLDGQVNVERSFTRKLLRNGFSVLERDNNMMTSFIFENPKNISKLGKLQMKSMKDPSKIELDLNINVATKILAYRVLELGVFKQKIKDKEETRRIGNAEIEVKIIDAVTSQILFCKVLNAYNEEVINNKELDAINNLHANFEKDAYPLAQIIDVKNTFKEINESTGEKKKASAIELNFLCNDLSNVKIVDASTGNIVDKFIVPAATPTQNKYKYTWDVTKVKRGKYNILIGEIFSGSFDVK